MSSQTNTYHVPVLLKESIHGLNINPNGVYVDLTFGGGGHSRAILERLSSQGQLFAFDKDEDAKQNKIEDTRFCLITDDYANMSVQLRLLRIIKVDGIIADLGISSHQIDDANRGFSFRFDSPLDLRMDRNVTITAADVVNNYSEQQLSKIFFTYGELSNAKLLSRSICKARQDKPIETTFDLCNIVGKMIRANQQQKLFAKIFQALRIEVNNELDSLENMLSQCADLLKPCGRLVVISYHSIEDRLVKNVMRSGNCQGDVKKDFYGVIETPYDIITRKPIVALQGELLSNPRSRSAKLRIAQRKEDRVQ